MRKIFFLLSPSDFDPAVSVTVSPATQSVAAGTATITAKAVSDGSVVGTSAITVTA